MTLDIHRIKNDLGIVLVYIDKKTFYHELAHELLRVGELKVCTEFVCESIGDNAIALLPDIRERILVCAKLLNLDDDYIGVVEKADLE